MERKRNIMIIDDNKMDILLLQQTINSLKFPVETKSYGNSLEAMEYLEEIISKKDYNDFPGLIFLDLNMPYVDGFRFLEYFMKFPKQVLCKSKIIIITSSDDLGDLKKTAAYPNVIDFILKPPQKIEQVLSRAFVND